VTSSTQSRQSRPRRNQIEAAAPPSKPNIGSLVLLSSIVISFLAASSAPTPLYATYAAKWHFSPITTTVVFGVYAIAVLLCLLVLGRLSDHVGRRPVLLAALALQITAATVLTAAGGVEALFLGRVLQGIATGGAIGALGAALLDVDRRRGTLANAAAPGIGTGTGALLSGWLVQYAPAPTHLVYLVLIGVFAVQGLAVIRMPETVSRKTGARAALRPELAVPSNLRGPVLAAAPILDDHRAGVDRLEAAAHARRRRRRLRQRRSAEERDQREVNRLHGISARRGRHERRLYRSAADSDAPAPESGA